MRLTLVFLLATALALTGMASATTAATKLNGTVGPGFTISLKSTNGKPAKQLKAGRYTFVIHDKASIHTFSLKGPGVSKTLTGATFVGTKSVTLRLKKGTYTFYCAVHPTTMTGKFKVT